MQMTDNEIVRNYREAKNKREQVTILADLNRCEKEHIIDILLKNGVDQRASEEEKAKKESRGREKSKVRNRYGSFYSGAESYGDRQGSAGALRRGRNTGT